jgi:coenzyme F420-0:L-glutamate ligase / coenzyme F420-1:gamma-L-glutamate ligase
VARLDGHARQFLSRQRVAHLATASPSGEPHVVPICLVVIDDAVYIALDEKPKRGTDPRQLRRVRNIIDNPRVSIVADVYAEDWSRLGFVLLQARARLVDAGAQHATAIAALRQKYLQYRNMALEERPVIVAEIERVITWGALDDESAD